VAPNRWLYLWAGMALGLLGGLGASLAAEMLDPTLKSLREVEALLPFPVLATLPRLDATAAAPARVAPIGSHRSGRGRSAASGE